MFQNRNDKSAVEYSMAPMIMEVEYILVCIQTYRMTILLQSLCNKVYYIPHGIRNNL